MKYRVYLPLVIFGTLSLFAGVTADLLASEPTSDIVQLQNELHEIRAQYQQSRDPSAVADLLRSTNKTATIRIGGEINVDYQSILRDRGDHRHPDDLTNNSSWALRSTNLRFTVDFADGVQARIKLDLSENQYYLQQQILEEAQIIWRNICGSPFGIIFGKGEVPYGQDRTLGIIQSYHHNDGSYSAEGVSVINGPLPGMLFNDVGAGAAPVWHPGEIDRALMAGVTFDWQDCVRVEVAVFQPHDYYGEQDQFSGNSGFENIAARIWWDTPIEGLVAELSGVRKFQRFRGDHGQFGEYAREDQYAFSAGFDWHLPEKSLELFGEYQMGINWNFTTGYNTHIVSLGGLYDVTTKLKFGLMSEWMRIDARGEMYDYNKFVVHSKYTFSNQMYLIGEYGLETLNWGSATAHLFGIRSGVDF